MVDKLSLDEGVHELKLGNSFDKTPQTAFHSMRYDFKPASVDTAQKSIVDIGEGNSLTVNVPHVEGSGTTHTLYKGNKRSCQKECVLIIDHMTGEFSIEKLANAIQLKKTRTENSSRSAAPASTSPVQLSEPAPMPARTTNNPTHKKVARTKKAQRPLSPPVVQAATPSQPQPAKEAPVETKPSSFDTDDMGMMTGGSSSSGDSSSNDSDIEEEAPRVQETTQPTAKTTAPSGVKSASGHVFHSMLSDDLRLSESSDSDY